MSFDLAWGIDFDLAVMALGIVAVVIVIVVRWLTRPDQDLAVQPPIATHEGDWDWPGRSEHNRLLRSE